MATRRISRAVSLLTAAGLSISAIALLPGTSTADPNLSISEVQQRVDVLYGEAEAATERAHNATVQVQQAREHLQRVKKQLQAQQKEFDSLSEAIADYAAQLYASGGIDPTLQMMFSSNPDDFLLQSQVLEQVTTTQDAELRQAQTAQLALQQTQTMVDQEVAHLRDLQAEAAKEKASANSKLQEAQTLLSRLKAAQRQRLANQEAQRAQDAAQASQDAVSNVPTQPTVLECGKRSRCGCCLVRQSPTRQAVCLRRRRTFSFRLLWPDDGCLGPGWRVSPALCERSVRHDHQDRPVAVGAR